MTPARIGLAFTIITALAWNTAGQTADRPKDEPALRERALALNNVTGDAPVRGQIIDLIKDPKGTRSLIAAAVEMAREKNQPFNYNGAFILGGASLALKELDAARTFYLVCAERASKLQSADKMLKAYQGLGSVIDRLYAEGKYDKSAKLSQEFLEILEKQGVSPTFKIQQLKRMDRALIKQGKVDEATRLVGNLLKARPSDWRLLELKGFHEDLLKHYAEAGKAYREAVSQIANDEDLSKEEKSQQTRGLQEAWIEALAQGGKVDEAIKHVDEWSKAKPDEWNPLQVLLLKAQVCLLGNRLNDAAKNYEQLVQEVPKDEKLPAELKTGLIDDIRYRLSGIYVDLDQVDKAAAQLKTLLKQHPDQPAYNNDLGYIWADHDKNLDEAERMIRKALDDDRKERMKRPDYAPEADKDNAAYVDSLGWVLFKKKNYKEAKKYLLQAVKGDDPAHIEIMDHLADVHMALGEKADAISVWKKSLTLEATTKREKDRKALIEKKLKALEDKNLTRKP
jgi:tetratricopeptide (TPR) repeat protein